MRKLFWRVFYQYPRVFILGVICVGILASVLLAWVSSQL